MIETVTTWAKQYNYRANFQGTNPRLVIVGENHNNEEEQTAQIDLVTRLAPKSILHEIAGGHIYEGKHKEWRVQRGVRMEKEYQTIDPNTLRSFVELAGERKIDLVGIDLTVTELAGEEDSQTREAVRKRELRMAQRMKEYHEKDKGNLMAIMGKYHMRENSAIHNPLKEKNIGYILVSKA